MSPCVHPGYPRKSVLQAGSFTRDHRLVATTELLPPLCHQAVQKWRDVERHKEEVMRRR